jgi:hypothetical protein
MVHSLQPFVWPHPPIADVYYHWLFSNEHTAVQWPTFPQVYIDGEFYGGCDIMLGMLSHAQVARTCTACLYMTIHNKVHWPQFHQMLKYVHAAPALMASKAVHCLCPAHSNGTCGNGP